MQRRRGALVVPAAGQGFVVSEKGDASGMLRWRLSVKGSGAGQGLAERERITWNLRR